MILHTCRRQIGDKRVEFPDVSWGIGEKAVEIGGGLSDGERDGISIGVEEMGFGWKRRTDEIRREGKEVSERERERVFERRKGGLQEVVSGMREFVEVKALHWTAEKPWCVEEGERERGRRNRTWWWRNLGLFKNFDCGGPQISHSRSQITISEQWL